MAVSQICEAKHAALDNDLETILKIDFARSHDIVCPVEINT